ncbi:MAG TPA: TIGR01777 family oxidoreductase, partial [Chryseosolibacter sp.]
IADRRWNERRKKEILLSRTESARLLNETLRTHPHHVTAFISASGISYYGLEDRGRSFIESDPPAGDFMAGVATAWEREVDALRGAGLRIVKVRTGVVLAREGGALKKLETPVKFFVGAPLGSGHQYVNWIHLDDLCQVYVKAIEDTSMQGAYNAVAPNPVTNRELTRAIAKVLKRPLWLPAVPGFAVKLLAGEVAEVVLKGGKVSAEKIEKAGFEFQFKTINRALQALYGG